MHAIEAAIFDELVVAFVFRLDIGVGTATTAVGRIGRHCEERLESIGLISSKGMGK